MSRMSGPLILQFKKPPPLYAPKFTRRVSVGSDGGNKKYVQNFSQENLKGTCHLPHRRDRRITFLVYLTVLYHLLGIYSIGLLDDDYYIMN